MEKVAFTGDSPQARFGHTITPIGKDKAILFGGAVGDTGTLSSLFRQICYHRRYFPL